ncbi:NAD-dependent dehydratase [Alcanivorax sp. HI0083]|nr:MULTISPECIES: SDR family oxidoreductase [unclassified Alcanivorax]KZY35096.1 NAD-dependent dehydratase [Alcanivorax sp. HI0044]KZZ22993.1 NAD-dependent dehydratase [Alcanivorax sp. HI0083]
MNVLIAGANGKIGRRLIPHLAADNIHVTAMVRDAAQAQSLKELGANDVVVADLEGDCREALKGQHTVIFTAGSGPHTGPDKTLDVDQNGAISLVDQAKEQDVDRFIMVSSMRADDPDSGPEKMRHYFEAKGKADNHLRSSGLDHVIVRPGRLTEEPPLGKIKLERKIKDFGEISREDVAKVLAEVTRMETRNQEFDVISGESPIRDALQKV